MIPTPDPTAKPNQARLLFGEMDRDGNGVLDEPEFGAMLRRLKSSGRRQHAYA